MTEHVSFYIFITLSKLKHDIFTSLPSFQQKLDKHTLKLWQTIKLNIFLCHILLLVPSYM